LYTPFSLSSLSNLHPKGQKPLKSNSDQNSKRAPHFEQNVESSMNPLCYFLQSSDGVHYALIECFLFFLKSFQKSNPPAFILHGFVDHHGSRWNAKKKPQERSQDSGPFHPPINRPGLMGFAHSSRPIFSSLLNTNGGEVAESTDRMFITNESDVPLE
jgi:hypothetical protein